MKRKIEHPPAPTTGRRYWRSLNEYADKPEFKLWLEKEFPGGAPHEVEMDGMSRRHFLRLMGASMALAGLGMAGCRRPEAYFVPYNKSPEWLIPGNGIQYATAMPSRWGAMPVLATCVDGRPIKIEPNRDMVGGFGGTDAYAQASILDLYDPYRARWFKKGRPGEEMAPDPRGDAGGIEPIDLDWGQMVEPQDFYQAFGELRKKYEANGGKGLAFLAEVSTSPTRERLVEELGKKHPQAVFATYDPVDNTNELEATAAVFGQRLNMLPLYEEADVILSFDSDFLGSTGEGGPNASKGFAAGRRRVDEPGAKMNRLYVIESRFSTTGGAADHRLRLASSHMGAAVVGLAVALQQLGVGKLGALVAAVGADAKKAAALAKDPWIVECAKDLKANPGKALIVTGTQQSPGIQALVYGINDALGALGKTIRPLPAVQPAYASIGELAGKMEYGEVETLIILGGNPAFNAPASLEWAEKQKKIKTVIRAGYYEDETTELSHWHVPLAHFLESWGDGRARNGAYVATQPMILPLFGGLSEIDLLGLFLGMVQAPKVPVAPGMAEPTLAPGAASLSAAAGGTNAAAEAASGQPETATAVSTADNMQSGAEDTSPSNPGDRLPQDEELPEVNSWYLVRETFLKTEDAKLARQQVSKAKNTTGTADENAWMMLLHDGFIPSIAGVKPVRTTFNAGAVSGLLARHPIDVPHLNWDQVELTLFADASVDDGRYVNNGWLQECPEPMTTLTWDNALLVSPATADKWVEQGIITHSTLTDGGSFGDVTDTNTFLGIPDRGEPDSETRSYNDNLPWPTPNFPMVRLVVGSEELDVPVFVTPGQAENSVALALGYGRRRVGPVGYGAGFDAYKVRHGATTHVLPNVKPTRSSKPNYLLALTQEHSSMQGRGLVREAPLAVTKEHPDWINAIGIASHTPGFPEFKPVYPNPYGPGSELRGQMQWGMAIDLNTCTGCNACVIACQSENNIPIVGKKQVSYGREMSWIRMDRYYSGDPNDPQLLIQPVACMQCEQAPCETVCPVNATVHSNEGLNVMAYNRCIGTRYCANNCPFKVRRFNYFEYNQRPIGEVATPFPLNMVWPKLDQLYYGPLNEKGMPDTLKMSKNPNVTVRMRGVMEKCTYCVQRIEEGKIAQLRKARNSPDTIVPDGAIRTACQDACASESIVFGDINLKDSAVAKMKANPRNYAMLDYTGVGPRTTYLGRVRNPNPAMPGAEHVGMTSEMHFGHGGGHGEGHGEGHGPAGHEPHPPKPPHPPAGHEPHPAPADTHGGGH